MSASRWKYKTEKVTVDENTVTVRGLTAGERVEFSDTSKKVKAGEIPASQVPRMVVKMGCTDALSDEDVTAMPGELLDAACTKILELSGVKGGGEGEEKKEDPTLN